MRYHGRGDRSDKLRDGRLAPKQANERVMFPGVMFEQPFHEGSEPAMDGHDRQGFSSPPSPPLESIMRTVAVAAFSGWPGTGIKSGGVSIDLGGIESGRWGRQGSSFATTGTMVAAN